MAKRSDNANDDVQSDNPEKENPPAADAAPSRSARQTQQGPDDKPQSSDVKRRQARINIDDSKVVACYANFCRVSSTPEEVILDLGLNPQPLGAAVDVTVTVTQSIVINHYTVKRLVAALTAALNQHEKAFGVLETDVRKRLRVAN
jgi:hypothetical protein